jgi:micrococcal nuclease
LKSSKTPDPKAVLAFLLLFLGPAAHAAPSRQTTVVESVLTGDTVKLQGGKELRYASLQSPSPESEIALSRQYGQDALAFNKSLVEGKTVTVEWGPQLRDKNNRLLGYVFLPDGTFVNRELLKNGHARTRITAPNLRYAVEFREDELAARRAKKGMWLKEPDDPKLAKNVWGNKVGKIFYYPDSPELDDVPEAQLVPFRSRVEAVAAGYKPCYSCRNRASATDAEES